MLEFTFECPACSLSFTSAWPYRGSLPPHRHARLATRCPGGGQPAVGLLRFPGASDALVLLA